MNDNNFNKELSREWTLNALAVLELLRRRSDGNCSNEEFEQGLEILLPTVKSQLESLVGMGNLVEIVLDGFSQLAGVSLEEATQALRQNVIDW
jgi:hypothetical protein